MQDLFFWAFLSVLIIAIGEFLYILSLKSSIRNIARDFSEKLTMDTNTTVSVSIADPEIRRLALLINRELKALRKERLRLQQGDQELKNAVTNIAHDLRTPLAAISGYLELMAGVPTDERGHRYLSVIRERTNSLKRLTEELFQYSIITSACDDINPANLSLKSELEIALAVPMECFRNGVSCRKSICPIRMLKGHWIIRLCNGYLAISLEIQPNTRMGT